MGIRYFSYTKPLPFIGGTNSNINKMEKNKKMKKIGFTLLTIGIIFFVLDKVLEIESLSSITKYGQWIFASGGAFLGMAYLSKNKSKE